MAAPKPKFMMLGKSKYVHTVHTEAFDRKKSECQQVRKYVVAGKINYKSKGLSAEAALALDGCEACATVVAARALIPADERKAASKEARDEVLSRARGDKPKKATKAERHTRSKDAKVKAVNKAEAKERKPAVPTKTKSGTRSVGNDAKGKAEALAAFCRENGWGAMVGADSTHTVMTAKNGGMVIDAFFVDGKYDVARHATLKVGSWQGILRGAHAVRRQVDKSLDDRDRPHPAPGKGRSGPRTKAVEDDIPEDESPEDAARRVPFLKDDEPAEIIDAVLGKEIVWRNGVSNQREHAHLPSEVRPKRKSAKRDVIQITEHPKTGKRMLSFLEVAGQNEDGEVYGPERTVALDKIVRVVG